MLPSTPPDAFVKSLLSPKHFRSPALDWGIDNEGIALSQYGDYQHTLGNQDLVITRAGFVICEEYPFLGASPDAYIYDPQSDNNYGLAEINTLINTETILLWMLPKKLTFVAH